MSDKATFFLSARLKWRLEEDDRDDYDVIDDNDDD